MNILRYTASLILLCICTATGLCDGKPNALYEPRWGFLGDDKKLKSIFDESTAVALVCVYKTELGAIKASFSEVVYRATVVKSFKGDLKIGNKLTIRFSADSLPIDEDERHKLVEDANRAMREHSSWHFLQVRTAISNASGFRFLLIGKTC